MTQALQMFLKEQDYLINASDAQPNYIITYEGVKCLLSINASKPNLDLVTIRPLDVSYDIGGGAKGSAVYKNFSDTLIPSGSLEEELNTSYDKGISHAMYVLMEKRKTVFDPTRKIIDEMLEEMRLLKHKP